MPRNPIPWPRLCAITREVMERALAEDDHEICERIKSRIAALRLEYPRPEQLTAALRAVERAMAKAGTPRADPIPPPPPRELEAPPRPAAWPLARSRLGGFTSIGDIARSLSEPGAPLEAATRRPHERARRDHPDHPPAAERRHTARGHVHGRR